MLASIVVGIVALGLLIFILRQIFTQLGGKVDKNEFREYCKRIDGVLISGTKKFDDIQATLKENTQQTQTLCKEVVKLQENIESLKGRLK